MGIYCLISISLILRVISNLCFILRTVGQKTFNSFASGHEAIVQTHQGSSVKTK